MNVRNTVFSQLMSLISDYKLRKGIDRFRDEQYLKVRIYALQERAITSFV